MINKALIYIFLIILLIIVLSWYFSDIFLYLVISLIIATILRPLVNNLNQITFYNISMPRALAILLSFGILIVVLALFTLLFVPLISDQIEVLSAIRLENVYANLSAPIVTLEQFLINNGLTDQENGFLVNSIREGVLNAVQNIDVQTILNSLISFTGTFFIGFLAITFITFFLLLEKGLLRRQIIALIPNQYFEVFIAAIFKIEKLLSNYLIGLLFQMFSIFSIASIGLTFMGVNYALTIGVFAAVANLIPYLGPLLGATFGIIVGISTSAAFELSQQTVFLVLKIVAVFGIVQATDNVILQPLIFSKSVKAHPLEIFVVIFAGATIAGIPGMIAAIPVYTIGRVSALEINSGFKRYQIFKN